MHSFSLILSLILPALYANIVLAVPLDLDSRDEGNANAYTGSGGQSPGGSVTNGGGLINVFSSKYHYMRLIPASDIDIAVKTTPEMADQPPQETPGAGIMARVGTAATRTVELEVTRLVDL